jgi:butyrate kinase
MKKTYSILVINPGSTSIKLSFFRNEQEIIADTITHTMEEIQQFDHIVDQIDFRKSIIDEFIEENSIELSTLDAVVGRGGLIHPISGGVFDVNQEMLDDLRAAKYGEHASNLGAFLAKKVAASAGCPAYIADPVVVDEMDAIAKLSGIPEVERLSKFHALNQKSSARTIAARQGKEYEEANFIVAHLGGGITVGAHRRGRVVDVNNGLDGDGPFTPERAGTVPAGQLVTLVLSDTYSEQEIRKKLTGQGGLVAYCGTNSLKEILHRIKNGDGQARLVFDAMAYQISKEIAQHGATLKGDIDAIILTGGMAYSSELVSAIRERVSFLAPVEVLPGEREMYALAMNVLEVFQGKQTVHTYTQESEHMPTAV